MISAIVKYTVVPGNVDTVIELFREVVPQILANEPGCLRYEISRSQGDLNVLIINELYVDSDALATHRSTPYAEAIVQGKIWPLLADRSVELFDTVITQN